MSRIRHVLVIGLITGMLPLLAAGCEGCRRPAAPTPGAPPPTATAEPDTSVPAVVDPLIEEDAPARGAETGVMSGEDEAREIYLADGTIVEVDEKTAMTIDRVEKADGAWQVDLSLRAGAIRLEVPRAAGRHVVVRTPVATVGVRGTEFAVAHDEAEGTEVSVFSGAVSAAADGHETTVGANRGAVLTRRAVRAAAIRQEIHQRWADARTRIADRLIERFEIDIEEEKTPELEEVLRRVPEAARARARQRMEERIQARREELRAALRAAADTIGRRNLGAQERFERARRQWINQDERRRAVFRERLEASGRRWRRSLEELADTVARLGDETAAARLRESARRAEEAAEELGETLARTAPVAPRFTVTVGPAEPATRTAGERRLLAHPFPALPGDHPLIIRAHTMRFRLQIGPGGAVRNARFIGGSVGRGEASRLERLLRAWRFNAIPGGKPEWREITIVFAPRRPNDAP